jgi:hypothetical protein
VLVTLEPFFLFLGTISPIRTYDVLRLILRVICMDDVNIKYVGGNWYRGTYKNYEFEAKVFEEPSKYGIPMHRNEDGKWEGKVSKLFVVEDQDWVMNYDRGWDIRPNLMNKSDCYKIIYDLEMSDLSVLECEHDDDYDFIIGSEIL